MIDIKKEFEDYHVQKRISGFSKQYAQLYFEAGFRLSEKEISKLQGQNQQLKKEYDELVEQLKDKR